MTSSSKSVIKEWSPEKVRDFIPPYKAVQPVIRELNRRNLDNPASSGNSDALLEEAHHLEEELERQQQKMSEQLEETARQVEMELSEAQRQAEEILEAARAEAEKMKENAWQKGFEDGFSEGRQKGMAEAAEQMEAFMKEQRQSVKQELSEAVGNIEQAKNRCIREYLDELRDCAFAVAEKVIHTSLEASGDIIKRMIVFETEKLRKTAWLKIYLEKMDYDMMMEADADLVTELTRVSDNIKFIVMEKEERGSCIIETPEEILDIGVETQMENIRDITGTIRV